MDVLNYTVPPFVPPIGAVITVTTGLDNLSDNGRSTQHLFSMPY